MADESTYRLNADRKDDHLALADAQIGDRGGRTDYDDVEFVHHALVGIDTRAVSLTQDLLGRRWQAPLYINAMTGGTEQTGRINRELAIAARETGIPIASGSMSIALDHPEAVGAFRVIREENPDGIVLANLGVGRTGDDALRAIELVGADAIQVHLNAAQETVMPEGSRDFSGWQRSVESIVTASPVPVVVKEVGFGLSRETLLLLEGLGVGVADISGSGGTDFVRIENDRRRLGDFDYLAGFGQSSVCCLLDAPHDSGLTLFGSGGVRNPLDAAKLLALGASAVGVAAGFLRPAREGGAEALVPVIRRWGDHLRQLLALLGAEQVAALKNTDILLRGRVGEYCRLRGIDAASFARRRNQARGGPVSDTTGPASPTPSAAPPHLPRRPSE